MMRRRFRPLCLCAALAVSLLPGACAKDKAAPPPDSAQGATPTTDEVTDIAEAAYVYAFPMMENYRTMFVQAVEDSSPGYAAPFNTLSHRSELLGPEFKEIVRPNNDTLYSFGWLDLRAQPVVISVPQLEGRYYSVQLVDMFTHNFAYIGTRATGTEAGSYVVAGPQWEGSKPGDAKKVFRAESAFVYCIIRIQVDGTEDLPAVRAIQKQLRLTPMNVFLGRSRVPVATGITFPRYDPENARSANFIDLFNFLLTQVVIAPEERALFARFGEIGIQPGALSASRQLTPELRAAVEEGVNRGIVAIEDAARDQGQLRGVELRSAGGWQGTAGLFGPGPRMRPRYLARALAALVGLYGNDVEEAYYPIGNTDGSGRPLDAGKHDYVMRFEKDDLPKVDAFWSMTMYGLPGQLMVENPIGRYSIGDRSGLRYARDGSLTIYIQRESPGRKKASNWLPAPDGPFSLQFRMYLPKPEALSPLYLPPAIRVAN